MAEVKQVKQGKSVFVLQGVALLLFLSQLFTLRISGLIVTGLILIGIYVVTRKPKTKVKHTGIGDAKIHDIDKMDGIVFEHLLAKVLKYKGYQASVTQASGDYGADLILQKGREKIVVQAKRYRNSVGIKAVQEIYSAKSFYEADSAWVITNSYFSDSAKDLALKTNVRLIDRMELINWLVDYNRTHEKSIVEGIMDGDINDSYLEQRTYSATGKSCPNCGSNMVVRHSKVTAFYGCSQFPKCRGTRPM